LIQGNADGAVVAEIGAHDRTRKLSVKPGRYFVRGRGTDFLLEGAVVLRPEEQHQLREQELEQIGYARLVRKGHVDLRHVSSVQVGYWLRTSLWQSGSLCHGPFAGYAIDLEFVSLMPRIGFCRGGFEDGPPVVADELDVEVRIAHAWDVGRVAIDLGASFGGSYLREGPGDDFAQMRHGAVHIGALAGVTVELSRGFYSGVELDAVMYFLAAPLPAIQPQIPPRASTPFSLRLDLLLLGKRW